MNQVALWLLPAGLCAGPTPALLPPNVGQCWIMGLLTVPGGPGTLILLQALPMPALVPGRSWLPAEHTGPHKVTRFRCARLPDQPPPSPALASATSSREFRNQDATRRPRHQRAKRNAPTQGSPTADARPLPSQATTNS